MVNGDVTVKIFWLEKKIEINVGSKITKDHWTYRGGVKYTIFMKDEHNDYQKTARKYAVNIPNFNDYDFLNKHQNVNNVGTSIGIISKFIMVAFQVILFA